MAIRDLLARADRFCERIGKVSTRIDAAKAAAIAFAERKDGMAHKDKRFAGEIGGIAFNDSVIGELPFTPFDGCLEHVERFVRNLEPDGLTNFSNPLLLLEDRFSEGGGALDPEVLDRVVFESDGGHNLKGEKPTDITDRLKARWVVVDTIGIGNSDEGDDAEVDKGLLAAMASIIDGDTRYRFISRSGELIEEYFNLAGTLASGSTAGGDVGFTGGYESEEYFYERCILVIDCSGSMTQEMHE